MKLLQSQGIHSAAEPKLQGITKVFNFFAKKSTSKYYLVVDELALTLYNPSIYLLMIGQGLPEYTPLDIKTSVTLARGDRVWWMN